jgi:hypothetical protein
VTGLSGASPKLFHPSRSRYDNLCISQWIQRSIRSEYNTKNGTVTGDPDVWEPIWSVPTV